MAKSSAALKEVPKELTTGELIDQLEANRQKRRKLELLVKPLEDEYKELKLQIIAQLDASNTLTGSSRGASVSISEIEVPKVLDIEKLVGYLVKKKQFHLFLAQPLTTPAWREAKGLLKGSDLPGTETFTKRDLNHSSLNK